MSGASVSVLIVTRSRPGRLHRLLESLTPFVPDPVTQVVVVDDSPAPADLVHEFPTLPLKHVTSGERLYISAAKNRGLRECSAPLVYFIDDDNVVDSSTFRGPIERLERDPKAAAVMPAVLYRRRPDLVWVYATPFLPGRWGFDLVGRDRPRDARLEGRLLPTDALPNASLVRRDLLDRIGGVDESLSVNSSADLCQRLKAAGGTTWADTGAFIWHDVEPPGETGYWAQHSVDPDRLEREVSDWFVFQRRMRGEESLVRLRSLWHATPFLLAAQLAFFLRRDARTFRLTARLGRGIRAGLGELPNVRYGAVGRPGN